MRDATEITDPLTSEAVGLITSREGSLLDRTDEALWDFQLFAGQKELLYIGDFSDLLVDEADSEILRRLGVEIDEQDDSG